MKIHKNTVLVTVILLLVTVSVQGQKVWEHAGHWDAQIGELRLSEFASKAEAEAYLARYQAQEQKQFNKNGSEVHLCGAPTKAGGKCKRHVKNAGDRCFLHKGK